MKKENQMNKKLGIYSSIVTFTAVFAFALCMLLSVLLNNDSIGKNGSYYSSIFIALGFIPMVCSYLSFTRNEYKSAGLTALAFSIMYGLVIIIVYFTQVTTVRLTTLSDEAANLLNYSKFNLFFNYDLLGYGFMALSTLFIGITIEPQNIKEKWLKNLLEIHGLFAICCFIMPILGIFNSNMTGGDLIGTLVLEFWCIYFMPICLLSYTYFKNK
jgi:hypothetical protein